MLASLVVACALSSAPFERIRAQVPETPESARARAWVDERYGAQIEAQRSFHEQIGREAYAYTLRLCYAYRLTAGWRSIQAPYLTATDARFRDSLGAWGRIVKEGAIAVWDTRFHFYREMQGRTWRDPETWAGSLFLIELQRSTGYAQALLHCLYEPDASGNRGRAMRDTMARANAFTTLLARADILGLTAHNTVLGTAAVTGALAVDATAGAAIAAGFRFLVARIPERFRFPETVQALRRFWASLSPRAQVAAGAGGALALTGALAWPTIEELLEERRAQDASTAAHRAVIAAVLRASSRTIPDRFEARLTALQDAYERGAEWHSLNRNLRGQTLSEAQTNRVEFLRSLFFARLDPLARDLDSIREAHREITARAANGPSVDEVRAIRLLEFMLPLLERRYAELGLTAPTPD